MAREDLKRDILRLVARHDGEWYWYQLDRALLGVHPEAPASLLEIVKELAAAGVIEIRPNPEMGEIPRYWLTAVGRSLAIESGQA